MSAGTQLVFAPDPYFEELRAVIASPDDDGRRLNYAARCGGIRAEFIETQVKLAALPGGANHSDAPWLTSLALDLLREHRSEFAPSWYPDRGLKAAGFDRGFAECVAGAGTALADEWLQQRLIESAPIRHLNFCGECSPNELRKTLDSTLGQKIVTLALDDIRLGQEALNELIHSKAAPRLRWLSMARCGLSFESFHFLAAHRASLPALEYTDFSGNPADPSEQYAEDQGVVVESAMPEEGSRLEAEFGRIAWLHWPVVNGRVTTIDRMALGRKPRAQGSLG